MKKMKKIFATCLAVACTAGAMGSFVACAPQPTQQRDNTKTQLDISFFAGGYGDAWIYEAKTEFEAMYANHHFEDGKTGVEVWIDSNKDVEGTLNQRIQLGTFFDLFFTTQHNIQGSAKQGYLADISDVYDSVATGDTHGKTIEQKLYDKDNALDIVTRDGKQYAIPYSLGVLGFVFDYGTFMENDWLFLADQSDEAELTAQGFTYTVEQNQYGIDVWKMESYSGNLAINYKAGDVIAKSGKDGLFGTYDDGQPVDMLEWEEMLTKIYSTEGAKAFIYAGASLEYVDAIAEAAWAQYDGLDNYNLSFSYDGTYVSPSTGEETVIDLNNGYKVFESEGRLVALEFMKDNLGNATYMHPACTKTSRDVSTTQNEYILGYRNTTTLPLTAMLCEGSWWENEARPLLKALSDSGETERGFGKRDYRYMLLPNFDGQKGIDGEGNGSVLSACEDGWVFVNNDSPSGEQAAAKKFIELTCSDAWLRRFTVMSGGYRAFEYELTDDDYNAMTPFARNHWNMISDRENVAIVRPRSMHYVHPINWSSSTAVYRFGTRVNTLYSNNCFPYIRQYSAEEFFNGAKNRYGQETWAQMVQGIVR